MTVQFAIPTPSRDFSQRASALWADIGLDQPDSPAAGCVLRFGQDQEIYGEGEEATSYYTVISGVVRTCKFLSDGRRQIDAFHVAGRWEGGGTHTGPAFSDFLIGALPAATGRTMRFTGTTVLRLENGKIIEEVGLDDGATALQQLGLLRKA